MKELETAGQVVALIFGVLTSLGWPPATAAAFWSLAAVWGVVSVIFDDETPRGIPGIEFILARRDRFKDVL